MNVWPIVIEAKTLSEPLPTEASYFCDFDFVLRLVRWLQYPIEDKQWEKETLLEWRVDKEESKKQLLYIRR